jgi:glycosyltransferase involved in cell wall biosynthesis
VLISAPSDHLSASTLNARIAWFSPMPPSTSGIAAYSAELIPMLAARAWNIDVFTDETARDFVWMQRRRPYDLTVYQLGNAACHDYMWGYLFRYPGMVVLHDAQLHQARALWLTKRWRPRRDDYLAEFRANHPDAPPDVGELVAAGLGAAVYQRYPMIRLVIHSARVAVVHNARVAAWLRQTHGIPVVSISMGVQDPRASTLSVDVVAGVRRRLALADDAIVVAAFGGITPEKRISHLFRAVSAVADRCPSLHVLLVGAAAPHYDVRADAARWGVSDRVRITGYVPDDELAVYMAAADICSCLRWPSNRETSASWLRCLGAGQPTLITDLAHLADVPTLDPRGWRLVRESAAAGDAVAIAIDVLDEDHSLQLALERLASDAPLRQRLGRRARQWWEAHHRLEHMADDYERVMRQAIVTSAPKAALPPHLLADGTHHAHELAGEFGVSRYLEDALGTSL